ncbi:MAG TPA: ArsA-related P-loop ATPase [Candidatus Dormibacteraeota bacterium]
MAGKGGTGKTTLAAALALVAARRGKRVLCIEVDAKGDLPRTLGSTPLGFEPRVVQPHISCLSFNAEEALAEYLKLYFKVPRFARLTPLARVFDFAASGVPGAKDVLVIGKIAFEEKRLEGSRHAWDLIIVDTEATGHVLPQLNAARAMMELVKGGIILGQVRWIDQILSDPQRTLLTICALPEDMPVTEAIELHDRALAETRIAVGACFLNRCFPLTITARQLRPLELAVTSAARRRTVSAALRADPQALLVGARLGQRLGTATQVHLRRLRAHMSCPVLEIPMRAGSREGLATARMVAASLAEPTT